MTTTKALAKLDRAAARDTAPRGFASRPKNLHRDIGRAIGIGTPHEYRGSQAAPTPLPSAAIPYIA